MAIGLLGRGNRVRNAFTHVVRPGRLHPPLLPRGPIIENPLRREPLVSREATSLVEARKADEQRLAARSGSLKPCTLQLQ